MLGGDIFFFLLSLGFYMFGYSHVFSFIGFVICFRVSMAMAIPALHLTPIPTHSRPNCLNRSYTLTHTSPPPINTSHIPMFCFNMSNASTYAFQNTRMKIERGKIQIKGKLGGVDDDRDGRMADGQDDTVR